MPDRNADETPATFAELRPPGYWSKTAGRFIEVRMATREQADECYQQLAE